MIRKLLTQVFVIDHKSQRYPTVGDYVYAAEQGSCVVNVSAMSDWRHEVLVSIHEQLEAVICQHRRIREEDITTFDQLFEHERGVDKHGPHDEPGDDPRAPYRDAHRFATIVEMMLARELGVDWPAYEAEVEAL